MRELLFAIADKIEQTPEFPLNHEEEEETGINRVLYKHEADPEAFYITREPDGAFVVSGEKIEKLFKMTNFQTDESIRRFSRQLRGLGVDEALRKKGAKDGDTVKLLEFEFEFVE